LGGLMHFKQAPTLQTPSLSFSHGSTINIYGLSEDRNAVCNDLNARNP
jgi:hypothetical protein